MSRKLTEFVFFKDTPLIDFQNTIHFSDEVKRDRFFLEENHYETITTEKDFNFIRDRGVINIDIPYKEMLGVNYVTFLSDFEPRLRWYAYVLEYEYINDNLTRVTFLPDGIMTFTQGQILQTLPNLSIARQHLSRPVYNQRAWELKNNDDVLDTSTKSYIEQNEIIFENFSIVIHSAVDLTTDFGDENNPKINTSKGVTFDKISSPLELYVIKEEDLKDFMTALNEFPWIAQNFQNMFLIPTDFLGDMPKKTTVHSNFDFDNLYRLENNGFSFSGALLEKVNELDKTQSELYQLYGLDSNEDKHLLRNEYTTNELYTYNGDSLFIDNGLLRESVGMQFVINMTLGFHNEIKIAPHFYNVREKENINVKVGREGSYLNESIGFNHFDDVPMLIDNYKLALAQNANQRALAESRQPTNRIKNVFDSSADLKDRFFDGASLVSNFSLSGMFGKFADEHEFYRNQQAEFKDLALSSPTITNQSHGNSFIISHDLFGFHQKFSAPSPREWEEIKKYYKLFGYDVNENGSSLQPLDSMTICNYVQFKGSWTIPNIDIGILEMMKAQFENGVRLWHPDGTGNPMEQNILNNVMR